MYFKLCYVSPAVQLFSFFRLENIVFSFIILKAFESSIIVPNNIISVVSACIIYFPNTKNDLSRITTYEFLRIWIIQFKNNNCPLLCWNDKCHSTIFLTVKVSFRTCQRVHRVQFGLGKQWARSFLKQDAVFCTGRNVTRNLWVTAVWGK